MPPPRAVRDFYLGTHDEITIMMKTTNQHDHKVNRKHAM